MCLDLQSFKKTWWYLIVQNPVTALKNAECEQTSGVAFEAVRLFTITDIWSLCAMQGVAGQASELTALQENVNFLESGNDKH